MAVPVDVETGVAYDHILDTDLRAVQESQEVIGTLLILRRLGYGTNPTTEAQHRSGIGFIQFKPGLVFTIP